MADWELMVPGIGLTVLGMAGIILSYAGIAKTFLEGMHAVSGLMMFIGMIIFASGMLKDGLPRSNQAKAAALIIIGFMATVGAFAVGLAEIPVLVTFSGILFLILIPAVVIAWAAHNKSPHFKAITILFSSASVVGVIAFSIFGIIAPQPIEAGVMGESEVTEEPQVTRPSVEVAILEGSSIEGSEGYSPREITIAKGTALVWTNNDKVVHTATSGTVDDADFGELFDSGVISSKATWSLNTDNLEPGDYVYFCTFHPFKIGKFTISEASELLSDEAIEMMKIIEVNIAVGSANTENLQFYVPQEVTVQAGTFVVWTNSDTEGHTVTSGSPSDAETGTLFDSGFPLIMTNERYEFTFNEKGEYSYFCQVHPWMVGKVIVT
ncbi:MAG: plastocyanin/azurin family copper-binding protein [Nitrososphaerales archaeon]